MPGLPPASGFVFQMMHPSLSLPLEVYIGSRGYFACISSLRYIYCSQPFRIDVGLQSASSVVCPYLFSPFAQDNYMMANNSASTTSSSTTAIPPDDATTTAKASFTVKAGLAQMLKGGVIMDVTNAAQARIAEDAGACAVMALERVPADIRAEGGVSRMSDPAKIKEIQEAVTIPVMAKARIGHFVECQVLEALGVDYIDESEVLTPADDEFHVEKAECTW